MLSILQIIEGERERRREGEKKEKRKEEGRKERKRRKKERKENLIHIAFWFIDMGHYLLSLK